MKMRSGFEFGVPASVQLLLWARCSSEVYVLGLLRLPQEHSCVNMGTDRTQITLRVPPHYTSHLIR